ncbi:MAG: hypothetical protein HYX44_06455, partial [Aquabacterium sp.]|nr:hypothetical protein [Aquabacterium sp.]
MPSSPLTLSPARRGLAGCALSLLILGSQIAQAAKPVQPAPDLTQMLQPMPLSQPEPQPPVSASPPRALRPLSPESLEAYSAPGAQALGSTPQGTLVRAYAI